MGCRAWPAGARTPGRRPDRGRRLRARRRGPADGAGLRHAGDAGPQRPEPAGLRLLRDPRGLRLHGARDLEGVGGPGVLQGQARPRRAAGLDRPVEAERQRLLTGGRPPVRRDRRPDRRPAREDAARGGPGQARPDLHLRRRRPGRRRHPRVLTHTPPVGNRTAPPRQTHPPKLLGRTSVSDWYRNFANSGVGTTITKQLGLPRPAVLRRYEPGQPLLPGPAVVGSAGEGRLREALTTLLKAQGVHVQSPVTADGATDGEKPAAVILDATGLGTPADLAGAHDFLAPAVKRLRASGRVLILAEPPSAADSPAQAAARQALDGLVRSIGKELRDGSTANLVYVPEGAEGSIASPVRFFLSGRSAYVDGQVVTLSGADVPAAEDADKPLAEKVAVVTGAARGIGAAIAEVMARDGAHVVAVDIPAAGDKLAQVANEVGGTAFQLDITSPDAAQRLIEHLRERQGGVDIVVHNAGITRDKLLVNMDTSRWNSVMAVNLQAQLGLTQALLDADGVLRPGARVVCVSSQSGIAGNRGQTNYAASKAGVIGMVRAWAPAFAERDATINAVAPGFIVTEMTAKMPLGAREVGSRINSLQQGGLPVDVAETIAWLSQPGSAGVNGQVVRVCGQSMLGA